MANLPKAVFRWTLHHRPDHVVVSFTSSTPSRTMFWLLDPTITLYRPFSHTQTCASWSQNAVVNRSNGMLTLRVSPGCKFAFAKPLSSFIGRAIDEVAGSAAIYSWTASAPATSPELRTLSVADVVSTAKSEYVKEVYDRPCLREKAN